jgi:hypothetical protein
VISPYLNKPEVDCQVLNRTIGQVNASVVFRQSTQERSMAWKEGNFASLQGARDDLFGFA